MFTQQQIEQALLNLHNADIQAQQQANDLIMRWSETPQSIVQAMAIINESQFEPAVFSACCVAEKDIVQKWMNYLPADRQVIRNKLCERLIGYQGNQVTKDKIIRLIVAIALKDWPEDWPTCVQDFISSATSSPEMCVLDFQIISELIVTIHETTTITNFRRKQLIEEFDKSTVNLMQIIDWSLGNVGFDLVCYPVIRLLKELCLTAPIEMLYSQDMFTSLFTTFAVNELCSEDAMIAINNLLINRSDAKEIASKLFNETLQILGNFCAGECPDFMLLFIMKYLDVYGTDIDELCFEGEDMIEDVANLVLSIYQTILNHPPVEEHCEEFWSLFRSVLYRYYRSSRSKNPFDALQPCFQLFQNLIPEIRVSLFNAFPTAAEGGKLRSINCQACWLFLASIDKKGMIEFLSEQSPSPSLCYSIGLVDACLTGKEEREMVFKIFPKLFEYNNSTKSVDFGMSLLYAISHAIRFMMRESKFLTAFGACLSTFLSAPDFRVRSSASNALLYVSMRQPKLLSQEPNPIINIFFNNLTDWVIKCELKVSSKIVKSFALVGSAQPTNEARNSIYEQIYNAVSLNLTSGDLEKIENGMSIVHSLTYVNLVEAAPLYIQFINPLIDLLGQSVASGNELSTSQIIETITAVILKNEFDPVKLVLDNFVRILLQLQDFKESVILSLAKLRAKFVPMEEFYDQIYAAHLAQTIPNLAQTQVEAYPLLRFFRFYNIRPQSISVLLEITVHFIKDERLDVSKEAAKLLRSLLVRLCSEQQVTEIINVRMHLLDATFTALTDTFHTAIFNQVAKTINSLYVAINSSVYPSEQFDNDVAEVLKLKSNDREFLLNFSRCLRSHIQDFPAFAATLKEFLVTTKCASPSDKRLFKPEIKLDSLAQELMNLVSTEEKGAILAEELEILPALANLKIDF
ncbi:hypothetical protein TRFO_12676 [Tritrichomonas foetus]|uniref:Exportin-1/Importin-beta-like domain-containing protein n=1 Tax=Tritrichomonas foetus TaxID=1144522 RepID=A0A1J4L135_9EUKA|nr:hypothetical protein TRFO_12676 [Tritrichomonas foetus]|eukprot:OHT17147.1 hypothetical protein TRFO_12676 [Tritrichomonas foetus]